MSGEWLGRVTVCTGRATAVQSARMRVHPFVYPALLCLVTASSLEPRNAQAYVRATVEGEPGVFLYWPSRTVEFWVHKPGSSELPISDAAGAIVRSFHTWSGPSCSDLVFNYAGLTDVSDTNLTRPSTSRPDGLNLVRWREEQWPPEGATESGVSPDWLALTVLVYEVRSGIVLDADMDLNGVNFQWTTSDDPSQARTDVQNVVTHEVGHIVGLDHSDVFESTMYAEQLQGELHKRELHQDDIDGLCLSYPFGKPTPLGPDQEAPRKMLIGGCDLGASPTGGGWPFALGLLLWCRTVRRRGRDRSRGADSGTNLLRRRALS